jgi:hypothetical protein
VTWQPGKQEILIAVRAGDLQRTAGLIADADPESAYVTAYDAARFALVGVLAQQGLRATQKGGHLAVEHAVRAQFGKSFAPFATLRRRRSELEYPSYPGEKVEQEELLDALRTTRQIIDGAAELLSHLSIFTDT